VLLTDAEELGLLGAKASSSSTPATDVRMAINFEARARTASWMFETSAGNARSSPNGVARAGSRRVVADSEIYRRLPNDTDFSEFKRLKTPG